MYKKLKFIISHFSLYTLILLLLMVGGCGSSDQYDDEAIIELLESEDINDNFRGNFLAGKYKRRNVVHIILSDPYNPKITHHKNFYGLSLYQSKMIALKNISKMTPPVEIDYKPDSTVVEFYLAWAHSENLITN